MSSAARVSGGKRTGPPAPSAAANDEDDERLLWSKDPEECWLGDWKIEISVGGESAIYNVHRAFLVSGTKRSDYFVRLFKNENFAESKQRTSRIVDLNQQALETFPLFLDYLYDLAMHEKMVRQNTAALYHLADYFGVGKLAEEIKEFWDRTMIVTECEFYFEQAKLFRIDDLMQLVVKIFSASIDLDTPYFDDSSSWPIFDSQFWLDVAKQRTGKWNPKLSMLVTNFCWKEQDALDAETFVKLTSERNLPIGSISFHSATKLLELEKKFLPPSDTDELTSLQTRCLEALSASWREMDLSKIQELITTELNPFVLSNLWLQTIERASEKSPTRIVVEGAGNPAVNGLYIQDGYFDNRPQFVRDGIWHGMRYKFYINLCNVSNNTKHWYISIVPFGGKPGTSSDIDFYSAPMTEVSDYIPPKTGWAKAAEGKDPAPTLDLLGSNNDNDDSDDYDEMDDGSADTENNDD